MKSKMNLEMAGAIFLAIFAIACVVVAIVFSAWWHIGTGVMSAILAWTIGKENYLSNYK